jgi:sorbitol-6-phosphate 2-dehydrogenase
VSPAPVILVRGLPNSRRTEKCLEAKESGIRRSRSLRSCGKWTAINQKAVFLCGQAAAKQMLKQDSGVIINMSSESGAEGSEGQSAYAATKSALYALTRSWAKELGSHGIRVVGIAPGILEETGLRSDEYERALAYTRGISVDDLKASYTSMSSIPLGRAGRLEEIADLATYLASDRASYIHGTTVNISGGKSRG